MDMVALIVFSCIQIAIHHGRHVAVVVFEDGLGDEGPGGKNVLQGTIKYCIIAHRFKRGRKVFQILGVEIVNRRVGQADVDGDMPCKRRKRMAFFCFVDDELECAVPVVDDGRVGLIGAG